MKQQEKLMKFVDEVQTLKKKNAEDTMSQELSSRTEELEQHSRVGEMLTRRGPTFSGELPQGGELPWNPRCFQL